MIRLMIVDDEVGIRDGLRRCIQWDLWEITIVGEAADGESAWQLALETQPDIVLTDIRMPRMDGIELSKRLKQRFPFIRIIMLTGYDDKKYLKAALDIGVKAFLVKPAGAEETIEAVLRQKNEILQEKKRREHNAKRDTLLEESLSVLQMHFINNLILQRTTNVKRILSKADSLGIPLGGPAFQIILLNCNPSEQYVLKPQHEQDVEHWHMIQCFNEMKKDYPNVFCCALDIDEFLFLINLNDAKDSESIIVQGLCQKFLELYKQPKYVPQIGIGEAVDSIERIKDSYRSAQMALYRAVWNKEKYIFYGPDRSQQLRFFHQPPEAQCIERDTILMITQSRFAEASEKLRQLFGCYYAAYADFDLLREACKRILMYTDAALTNASEELKNEQLAASTDRALTADELLDLMLSKINGNPGVTVQNHSKIISKVTTYMKDHYMENISLQDLAKEVFLSPGHLSLTFRKETGMKINDWLNCLRIEQAKLLLADDIPITEIAEHVGFSSYKYFSMMFLKYANMSARNYRNQILAGSEQSKNAKDPLSNP